MADSTGDPKQMMWIASVIKGCTSCLMAHDPDKTDCGFLSEWDGRIQSMKEQTKLVEDYHSGMAYEHPLMDTQTFQDLDGTLKKIKNCNKDMEHLRDSNVRVQTAIKNELEKEKDKQDQEVLYNLSMEFLRLDILHDYTRVVYFAGSDRFMRFYCPDKLTEILATRQEKSPTFYQQVEEYKKGNPTIYKVVEEWRMENEIGAAVQTT